VRRERVMDGMVAGRPTTGPHQVHIDITNACNAACITCWDHSPLLTTPRPASWKRQRLSVDAFHQLVDELRAFGSVQAVVISGMGDPLVHPHVYEMLDRIKAEGWHLTVLSNLLAADPDRLAAVGIDNLLVGVHGATPEAYTAFHPGWTEMHFFKLCKALRVLQRAGTPTRHVQVINEHTAPEVVQMVKFGQIFGANRVNFKLASLEGGTQSCAIRPEQREALLGGQLDQAAALADRLGVPTNLPLFRRQLEADAAHRGATVPIAHTGCFMGYVYTRISVTGDVLYCCNTQVKVGQLGDQPLTDMWNGTRWQTLRGLLRSGVTFSGCERCGKFEQNAKWSERVRAYAGDEAWRACGAGR